MRRKIFASIVALAAGASAALAQGRPVPQPSGLVPDGLYGHSVAPTGNGPIGMAMPPGNPGMGGPTPMGGAPMGGDPAAGMMGGMPVYPPPGYQGMAPDTGIGNSGIVPTWWVNSEYLLWFTKSQPARQPFVTTSAPGDGGQIGQPTTLLLHSNGDLGTGLYSGFRIMGGWFRDADKRCGFEFGGFLSENKTNIFTASSDANGVPVIARPFIIASGGNGVFTVANIGQAAGTIIVANTTRFYGAEGSFINNLYRSCPDDCNKHFWTIDAISGFRFLQLREDLTFDSASTVLGGGASFVGQPVVAGGQILVHDSFESWNQFYGGQLGLKAQANWGRCYLNFVGKCAIGLMHQSVDVAGSTTLSDPGLGINATATGGLYATSQNIGNYTNDEFAVIPEFGVTLGYNWCSWFSTYIGYNGIYVSDVARPGDALPLAVNPSLVPASNNFGVGAVTPVPNTTVTQSDFWIQGVTFGFRVQW